MFVKISKAMYDRENRKYMEFDMGHGDLRTVKVPWRYNRVMNVKIIGISFFPRFGLKPKTK